MPCFGSQLARLALRRPANFSTSSTSGLPLSFTPKSIATNIPIRIHASASWRANSTLASPTLPTTRCDHRHSWKVCKAIQILVRNNELDVALSQFSRLPRSSLTARRTTHVVLHSLLRKGLYPEASFYAQHALNRNISLRPLSLRLVMQGLVETVKGDLPTEDLAHTLPLQSPHIITQIDAHTNQNPDLMRSALALYAAEHTSKKLPSDRLFGYLMILCFINGEIILASLLFGWLMREWQARDMACLAADKAPSAEGAHIPEWTEKQVRRMCIFIQKYVATDLTDPTSQALQQSSLQALAYLAYTLDRDRIPYGRINILIKTLLLCPRGPAMVWIPADSPDGDPQKVEAYAYIHSVLERLLTNLPEKARQHKMGRRHPNFTWLGDTDYFKLVDYALKHRQSHDMTKGVLLQILQDDPSMFKQEDLRNVLRHAKKVVPSGELKDLLVKLDIDHDSWKWDPNLSDYTYCTIIESLTKEGRANIVLQKIPRIIPGLFTPIYNTQLTPAENGAIWRRDWEEGLRRGVLLGPVVFVTLMNAARSLGKTRIVELIFKFALRAQERSWDRVANHYGQPWCLPVHAYTIMIRVYGREMNFQPNEVAYRWGQTFKGDGDVSRNEMGRRMIVSTVRRMMKEQQILTENVKHLVKREKPKWLEVPHADGLFFNALIQVFRETPNDPLYLGLKGEMEQQGFRPPAAYLESLRQLGYDDHHLAVDEEQPWRAPKDLRPFAHPGSDNFAETHAPGVWTKKLIPQPRVSRQDT